MPKIDENDVMRRLKLLSQIEPSCGATERAINRVRLGFSWGTATTSYKIKSPIFRFAVAAVLLICAGFLTGRLSTPQPVDAEQLRADLVKQMNQQWESILEARHAQLREEVYRQVRRELTEFAAQTLTASKGLTDQRLVELIRLIEAARMQDRQRIAAALEQVELNRLQDKTQFRNGLQTLVARASEAPPTTQN
jgi:parvulin-like peptidyl-prolyl isomerase